MKNGWFFIILFIGLGSRAAGQCNEIFISEYVEGFYNNKAIEIYNPGRNAADLTQYRIVTWHNGISSFNRYYCDTLEGSLPGNATLVIVINKRDSSATGLDTIVTPALRKKAGLFISRNQFASMSMNFNGDDPVSLEKKTGNNWVMVDLIGKIGEKPEIAASPSTLTGWSDSFPHHTGKGTVYTKDHTLIRKRNIRAGVTTSPAYFNPAAEWTLLPVNMFDSLGSHHCECQAYPAEVQKQQLSWVSVYPNPSFGYLCISGLPDGVPYLISADGKKAAPPFSRQSDGFRIETTSLPAGVYSLIWQSAGYPIWISRLIIGSP